MTQRKIKQINYLRSIGISNMIDKLSISDKISAMDMENGLTYIGQLQGRFNVSFINYIVVSSEELTKISKEKNKSYKGVLKEYYLSTKEKKRLEINHIVIISHGRRVMYYDNILNK